MGEDSVNYSTEVRENELVNEAIGLRAQINDTLGAEMAQIYATYPDAETHEGLAKMAGISPPPPPRVFEGLTSYRKSANEGNPNQQQSAA